jgi:hypothetical protein
METLEKIKTLTEELSVDVTKFEGGNKSAGTRARKTSQELKSLLQQVRGEILESRKND